MVRKQSLGNSRLVGIVQMLLNESRNGGTTYTKAGFFNHKELLWKETQLNWVGP